MSVETLARSRKVSLATPRVPEAWPLKSAFRLKVPTWTKPKTNSAESRLRHCPRHPNPHYLGTSDGEPRSSVNRYGRVIERGDEARQVSVWVRIPKSHTYRLRV